MKIRYIGAHDEVTVEVAGREVDVQRGADVDVPAAVAGTPPTAAFLAAMKALDDAHLLPFPERHQAVVAANAALVDVMAGSGSGFLAQIENWEAVASVKKSDRVGDDVA